MFTDPQRFLRRDATRSALFGRPSGTDSYEVRAFALALVFQKPLEHCPRRRPPAPAVARLLHQLLRVEVFDRHEVVLPGVVVRQFVEKVAPLPLEVGVAAGDRLPLLLPVVRPVFLPREVPLLTFETVALDRKSTRLNSSHITRSRMPSSA